jgi:hypothetical protein
MAARESEIEKHLDAFQDLEAQVGKLNSMVEILVLIRGETESRGKAERMFLAIENLERLMQGFATDYNEKLDASLGNRRT